MHDARSNSAVPQAPVHLNEDQKSPQTLRWRPRCLPPHRPHPLRRRLRQQVARVESKTCVRLASAHPRAAHITPCLLPTYESTINTHTHEKQPYSHAPRSCFFLAFLAAFLSRALTAISCSSAASRSASVGAIERAGTCG